MGLTAVILCGGEGSRLWPVSRKHFPKPFIKMPDNESLLQKTLERARSLPEVQSIIVVANNELLFQLIDEIKQVKSMPVTCRVILEPFGRNTAAAVAAAALEVTTVHDDRQTLLIMPADHLISDQQQFNQAVQTACNTLQSGDIAMVAFGIKPGYPETGYGYLKTQKGRVVKFVEKPDINLARQYLNTGNYFWNSGMFCFTCASIVEEFEKYCPEVLHSVRACLDISEHNVHHEIPSVLLNADKFARVPDISIDYAIMEKSDGLAMVPSEFSWNDIGSWESLSQLETADENGNILEAETILHNVSNCYFKSENRLIGAVGVDNLLIIDTLDALLVADREAAQDVKHIYNKLKQEGHSAHLHHCRVARPWGAYTVLEEGKGYKIKRIEVNPGASLSLQMHRHRSEHWVVVAGQALVRNGDNTQVLHVNESTFISPQHKHRLQNQTNEILVIIEVQSGSYLGEDDIVRFDDQYYRHN